MNERDEIDRWLEIAKKLLQEWEEQMEPDSIKLDESWGASQIYPEPFL